MSAVTASPAGELSSFALRTSAARESEPSRCSYRHPRVPARGAAAPRRRRASFGLRNGLNDLIHRVSPRVCVDAVAPRQAFGLACLVRVPECLNWIFSPQRHRLPHPHRPTRTRPAGLHTTRHAPAPALVSGRGAPCLPARKSVQAAALGETLSGNCPPIDRAPTGRNPTSNVSCVYKYV